MPSKDPHQQQLRNHKRQWNASYKSFTQKLKAFKNGLNGKGDEKARIPPSKIQDAPPPELNSTLSQLTSEFQQLIGDAGAIVSEQSGYSKTRRKKAPGPKVVVSPNEVKPQGMIEQLTQRLGQSSFELEKTSSSRMSRGLQYLSSVFSKDPLNKKRTGLLRQAADLFYSSLDFENDVLTLSVSSISNAISRYETMRYNFLVLQRSAEPLFAKDYDERPKLPQRKPISEPEITDEHEQMLQEQMEREPEESEAKPQQPRMKPGKMPGSDVILTKIENELRIAERHGIAPKLVRGIKNLLNRYYWMPDTPEKKNFLPYILQRYQLLLKEAFTFARNEFGANVSSMEEVAELMDERNKEASSTYTIEKYARNPITRQLKRWLVNLAPFNKTASVRLEVVRLIDEMKKQLQVLMDALEKGLDINVLDEKLNLIEDAIDRMRRPMQVLSIYYKESYISEERKRAPHKGKVVDPHYDPFLSPLLRRRVRRDWGEGLF